MSFGKMRTFIHIIEKSSDKKDSEGFANPSEKIIASTRAYKEARHGNERWANMAAFSTATVLFRFRKNPKLEVTAKHYISEGGDIYNIVSVEDVRGRGMYIEVLAELKPKGTVI